VEEYGEDSDFVRVRVRGLPPRAGISNFISVDSVQAARHRDMDRTLWMQMPKRLSVDPARFGEISPYLQFSPGNVLPALFRL